MLHLTKIQGVTSHYNVAIGSQSLGMVSRDHYGLWRAYWYTGNARNLLLGKEFTTRREAVSEIHIKAVGEGIIPINVQHNDE